MYNVNIISYLSTLVLQKGYNIATNLTLGVTYQNKFFLNNKKQGLYFIYKESWMHYLWAFQKYQGHAYKEIRILINN